MSPRNKELSEEMRAHSRDALLKAARKLFAAQGYFNCKVSDIAREAGMSQGNVYWYFSSKEDLLKAVLADGFDTLGGILAQAAALPGTCLEKLDLLFERVFAFACEYGDFNQVMLSILGHGGDTLFLELGFDMPRIGLGYTQSVSAIIAKGQEEGIIAGDIDPVIPTMFFFSFFNGLNLTYARDWVDLLPLETIKQAILRLIGVQLAD